MKPPENKPKTQRRWIGLIVLIMFGLCCGCGAAFTLFQATAPGALPGTYLNQMCVGAQAQPPKISFWWALPYISALPPHFVPSHVCVWVPWPPFLPPIGGFGFPP